MMRRKNNQLVSGDRFCLRLKAVVARSNGPQAPPSSTRLGGGGGGSGAGVLAFMKIALRYRPPLLLSTLAPAELSALSQRLASVLDYSPARTQPSAANQLS